MSSLEPFIDTFPTFIYTLTPFVSTLTRRLAHPFTVEPRPENPSSAHMKTRMGPSETFISTLTHFINTFELHPHQPLHDRAMFLHRNAP